jgi:hypothetical protein
MIKFILKVVCISLLSGNFMFAGSGQSKSTELNFLHEANFEELKTYLGGNSASDFFIIAITRNRKETLNPFEISFLRLLLHQLFNGPMELEQCTSILEKHFPNKELLMAEANGVNSYIKTLKNFEVHKDEDMKDFLSILEACNFLNKKLPIRYKAHDYQSTISIQRTNNECTQLSFSITKDDGFSVEALTNATGIIAFNEYFFGNTPFPCLTVQNYSKSFSQINEHYLFACNFLTYTNEFESEQKIKSIKNFNNGKVGKNRITESKLELQEGTNGKIMMENKTFYARSNTIVSTYNKSSYFKENDEFLSNEQAFYCFGDAKDHPTNDTLAKNISTEICRDVSLGLRKEDTRVNLHLIQSNTLNNLTQYTDYLPLAWCYVFCDHSVANRNIYERNRDGRSHVYFNSVVKGNLHQPCYSCSFDLHNCKYDINIYKIK